jgi:hypothetical protein
MTDLAESLDILKDFPPVPTNAWEASIHVDLKGEDYNKKLVWNSDEGIEVRPYYRSEQGGTIVQELGYGIALGVEKLVLKIAETI